METPEDYYYKFGLFYYNKNNPKLWVPKAYGLGWTLKLPINISGDFGTDNGVYFGWVDAEEVDVFECVYCC